MMTDEEARIAAATKLEWIARLATETHQNLPGTAKGMHTLLIRVVLDVRDAYEMLRIGSAAEWEVPNHD
ncbi:MAG TPA: hypothetical protein ENH11_00950 [Candidatus Acetothermia bacterium]|nr:hypothetical protein [Candidatus Acetothermia bacterium]